MLHRAACHTGNELFILDSARLQTHAAGTNFRLAPEVALRKELDVVSSCVESNPFLRGNTAPIKDKIFNKIKYL